MKPGASEDSLERACEGCIRRVREECRILETLVHENIIRIKNYGFGIRDESLSYFVFMELANGSQLVTAGRALSQDDAKGFLRQILDGVAYIQSHRVAHRDLKHQNVLLTSKGVVKIIDFGLSHRYDAAPDGTAVLTPLTRTGGSRSYVAPEVLSVLTRGGYDGFAADVWSTGVSLFTMLSGFFPIDTALDDDWRYVRVRNAQAEGYSTVHTVYAFYEQTPNHLSAAAIHLLDHMLVIDPANRYTMEQVRAHPWVTGDEFHLQPLPPPPPPPPPPASELRYRGISEGRGAPPEPLKLTRQNAFIHNLE